jgi:hypothetical protein
VVGKCVNVMPTHKDFIAVIMAAGDEYHLFTVNLLPYVFDESVSVIAVGLAVVQGNSCC